MNPPCGPCQREGGFQPEWASKPFPPQESVPPYTGKQFLTDEKGNKIGECWPYEPMCSHHARRLTEVRRTEEVAQKEADFKSRNQKES